MELDFLFLAPGCNFGDDSAFVLTAREKERTGSIETNGKNRTLMNLQSLRELPACSPKANEAVERAGGESGPFCIPTYRRDAGFSCAAIVILF